MELYPHNEKAYLKVQEEFKKSNYVAVAHPTGTGKSYIALKWIEESKGKRILYLAPTRAILYQIEKNLKEEGISKQEYECLKGMTYQGLMKMSSDAMEEFSFDEIILDEFHRCGAPEWSKGVNRLLEKNSNAQVLGLSATPIRYLDNERNMAEELFDGHVASEMSLVEAFIQGILQVPNYIGAIYSLMSEVEEYEGKIQNLEEGETKETAKKLLKEFKRRVSEAKGIREIVEAYLPSKTGKYIVFCRDEKHLEEMMKEVPTWFSDIGEVKSYYLTYKKNVLKEKTLGEFYQDKEPKVRLLFAIDMLNEGIHVPDIDGVIMLRPTSSPILFRQQLGRALAVGKNKKPTILDIVNNGSQEYIYQVKKELEEELKKEREQEPIDVDKITIIENLLQEFQILDEYLELKELANQIESTLLFTWKDWYQLAKNYYEEHGDLLVPKNCVYQEKNLGSWISIQRASKAKQALSGDKIQKLESIGMVWDVYETQWAEMYELAKQYYEEHGDLLVPHRYIFQGKNLGIWIRTQRTYKANQTLSEDKIQKLESIGMVWDVLDTQWTEMYELAKQYYEEHGDLLVPTTCVYQGKKLGAWISTQRVFKAKQTLSEDKIQKLESIGMVWDVFDSQWAEMYELAKQYYEEHGDLLVLATCIYQEKNLGTWIGTQRSFKANQTLSEDKIQKLEAIGMVWKVRGKVSNQNKKQLEKGNLLLTQKTNHSLAIITPSIVNFNERIDTLQKLKESLQSPIDNPNKTKSY